MARSEGSGVAVAVVAPAVMGGGRSIMAATTATVVGAAVATGGEGECEQSDCGDENAVRTHVVRWSNGYAARKDRQKQGFFALRSATRCRTRRCNVHNRFCVIETASSLASQPMTRRPSFFATASVVPEPQKKSPTSDPSSLDARIKRSRSFSGF